MFINASTFEIPGGFFGENIDLIIALGFCCISSITFALVFELLVFKLQDIFLHVQKQCLTAYLHSFKCRLKLANVPLTFEGSKSLLSFSFTLRINSQG